MKIKAVFFDVGETLVDESRDWNEWADYLGVSRHAFHASLRAVIERGEHHRRVFDLVRPGVDFATLRQERESTGSAYTVTAEDLYPDVVPCLKWLREAGILVGIAGNQPVETERALRALGVPADIVASSASWGVEKPDARFFERIIAETDGFDPSQIAYVGDRLDNDVEPARRAGMISVFLRRGPWARIQSRSGRFETPPHVMDDLSSLPGLLRGI
ncbi:HAD family hydrolase [Burkholderia lata]|uniref:phosphoglycolate phosphatase n=1 Tax=Burkholderia lata (strain ATCC 17760 / DSM 23089 / LMG 22485 / NCIMB 9086 / R18194 / 383) TaxID=482957 RepID=A0A6P2X1R8_BURL3|nr:HAD family hydrolase [Burkholderia lata]VWD02615.1 Phosphatase [Burkholderia lata]